MDTDAIEKEVQERLAKEKKLLDDAQAKATDRALALMEVIGCALIAGFAMGTLYKLSSEA